MDIIQAIILGIVQGLAEFLPVASAGQVILVTHILGVTFPSQSDALAFNTLLHLGTLTAIVGFFYRDLIKIIKAFIDSLLDIFRQKFKEGLKEDVYKRLAWLMLMSTIPAAIVGALFNKQFEILFGSVVAVGIFLIINGFILYSTNYAKNGKDTVKQLTFRNAFLIGVMESLALFPGISRSGTSISAGLFLGLERECAARYAFLIALPVIGAAVLFEIKNIGALSQNSPVTMVAAYLAVVVFGYLSIGLLIRLIKSTSLKVFAYYCWIVGALTLILSYAYGLI
ncbi:Undecaprenyl-diphosphatase [Methanobacterium lacus]|uniref:Undecaprenyl-diphosphatase n=1 Tax=Methanobacterium lacus (strain AL-21) TaxID=877455 RepID=F0TBQ0_METLA|nr:undecaprenyl-diphosphate phosphatase [Methanobacterium lacus]ADZ09127.1 Undecaprenyl-diphosphatase [Methanobacterium lacus]